MIGVLSASRAMVAVLVFAVLSIPSHADDHPNPARSLVKGDTILVTVNGQPVRRALYDGLVKARSQQTNPYDEPDETSHYKTNALAPVDQKAIFEDLLSMEVLAQKARERGIHRRPEVAAEAELQYKTLLQQELVRDIIAEIRIDPAEIQARYDAQKPERSYKVSHILVNSEQQANSLIRKLNKGAKFSALARKHTLDTHTKTDGMLGWMMASQLEPSFVAMVEMMKPGGISPQPVQTPYGWHVVQLHAARFLDKPPLATARTWLRQEILHEKVSARLQQFRQEASIVVPSSTAGASEQKIGTGDVR